MNDIADDAKKRAILLSVCGPTTYKIIHNLPQPKKSSDLSFVEWFSSRETTISHRSQFGSSVFVSTPTGDTQVRLSPATCVHCWAPSSLRALSVWSHLILCYMTTLFVASTTSSCCAVCSLSPNSHARKLCNWHRRLQAHSQVGRSGGCLIPPSRVGGPLFVPC